MTGWNLPPGCEVSDIDALYVEEKEVSMLVGMLQVYPFHGDDVQAVYTQLNSFLNELPALNVGVEMENVRANTKCYPDYGSTHTTIEVALYLGGSEPAKIAEQIRELHRVVLAAPAKEHEAARQIEPEPSNDSYDPFLNSDILP